MMTKEGSTVIVNSMIPVAVVFVLGRVPITAFLSFKYFMQGLINCCVYMYQNLRCKHKHPLNNDFKCPRHIFIVTLPIPSSSAHGKKIKVKLCTIGQQV